METLFLSALAVAVAEIGDKTQLLALLLASRYRRPIPIIAGIFVATVANHAVAAWLGQSVGQSAAALVDPQWLRWGLGLSFVAMGLWVLAPDSMDEAPRLAGRFGAFASTAIAFFLVEIGDKTQVATVVLAARFSDVFTVTAGTTLGMLAANVPVVLLGEMAATRLPLAWARRGAAALFVAMGLAVLLAWRL